MKKWKQNSQTQNKSVGQIVSERTGMPADKLLRDDTFYEIKGMGKAVALTWKHICQGSEIYIYTDYDVDGIESACNFGILFDFFPGCKVNVKIPCRFSDGYGLKESYVRHLKGGLLITVDNGIAATEAVAKAKENGMDVIILDHHMPPKDKKGNYILPNADVIVDPHVTGGTFTGYCGAGLAYKFAEIFLRKINHGISKEKVNAAIRKLMCNAAVATVADSVPLTGENRRIVKNGLKLLEKKKCQTGLKLLCEEMFLKNRITETDIGFKIAPAMNAYGRLEDKGARKVYYTVSYDGRWNSQISDRIKTMILKNKERKEKTLLGVMKAEEQIKNTGQTDAACIVLYLSDCEEGIAGIIAGRVTERYKVPSLVLTDTNEEGVIKGSGRSPDGYDLKRILDANRVFLKEYGGHPGACGVTVPKENFEELKRALDLTVKKWYPEGTEKKDEDDIFYDFRIQEDEAEALMEELERYAPYGKQNANIIVRLDNLTLVPGEDGFCKYLGEQKQHVLLCGSKVDVLAFDYANEYRQLGEPHTVSVVGILDRNVKKDSVRLQIQALDVDAKSERKPDLGKMLSMIC